VDDVGGELGGGGCRCGHVRGWRPGGGKPSWQYCTRVCFFLFPFLDAIPFFVCFNMSSTRRI
jgi:hypothetical protein